MREIRDLNLAADLVTLSACDTGVGALEGEEGIANLVRAFLFAGAKSVVASLWAASDVRATTLQGGPPYQETATCSRRPIQTSTATFEPVNQQSTVDNRQFDGQAMPFYWVGFIMVGDGSTSIPISPNRMQVGYSSSQSGSQRRESYVRLTAGTGPGHAFAQGCDLSCAFGKCAQGEAAPQLEASAPPAPRPYLNGYNQDMTLKIPARVAANCRKTPEGAAWLDRLPETLGSVERKWSLTVGAPFDNEEVSCAWVAPVALSDGTAAVLKLGMPHMEGEHEVHGLRFWDGDPTVRVLEADDDLGAMLLERCEPGTTLRSMPEPGQDLVISGLLRQLWRLPSAPHPFRPLSMLMKYWSNQTLADVEQWPDTGLVREGLRLLEELPRHASTEVLLATDLHAGNVLRSERKPWLVIDPKPFVGDRAYDSTQHLFNCDVRLRSDPDGMIRRIADLLGMNHERIRLWTFARAAAEPRDDWSDESWIEIARATSP